MKLAFWKATPKRSERDQPANFTYAFSGSKIVAIDFWSQVLAEQAMQHPVIWRCLHKIATSVQTVRWYAAKDESLPANQQSPATAVTAMNDLLGSPNDNMTPDVLRYWMALNYAVYGRIPFKVGKGVENRPNGIYPLAADKVSVTLDGRGLVTAYNYGFGGGSETLPTRRRAADNQNYAAEIRMPTLSGNVDASCTISPLKSIGLPAQVINLLLKRAAETASGHPNAKYVIVAEKELTEPQKNALAEHLENRKVGGDESGAILFLHGTKIEIHTLNNDLSDIHSKMPSDDMQRMIFGAFGIPVALMGLGAADGAKFAGNYEESRAAFWEDTIIPWYLSPIASGMTAALCPPGMVILFDHDTIPALTYKRVLRAKELSTVGFLTVEEKREMAGFSKKPEDGETLDRPQTPAPVATNGNGNGNA